MKRLLKRVSALLVSAALTVSLMVVPSYAATGIEEVGFTAFVGEFVSYFTSNGISNTKSFLEKVLGNGDIEGMTVSAQRLQEISFQLNNDLYYTFNENGLIKTMQNWYWTGIAKDPAHNNIMRIYNTLTNQWFVKKDGTYPYCSEADWDALHSEPVSRPSVDSLTGKFVSERGTSGFYNQYHLVSQEFLVAVANKYNTTFAARQIVTGGKSVTVYVVATPTNNDLLVFCASDGKPYVALVDDGSTAIFNSIMNNFVEIKELINNKYTTINNSGGSDPQTQQYLIDIKNMLLQLINEDDGTTISQDIHDITYDQSTHSYNVTTYNNDYDITNNSYEYNYYTYNIQYTYNNTYITYIGSTAEYQPKEWELYYELPDGRSSADLTEEDVAGLCFQFADCINYKKSATDTRLRALYHFDGNVNDVSYFSDKTAFTWNKGASITYMDANAFNGCLYLDEKEHQFTVTLPSNIGSGDFTLQWRYYQNNAAQNDHNENYVTIGGQKLLGWSEQYFYSQGTTRLSTGISIGTWQELALVRNKGTVYIYHNGVKIGSFTLNSVLSNQIVFYLGPNSRGYSMLDEMRFVKGALYTAGEAYTPTTVPYDTNQVLVLPDSPTPVTDAYWQWDKTITPKYSFDFSSLSSVYFPAKMVIGSEIGSNIVTRINFDKLYGTNEPYFYCRQNGRFIVTKPSFISLDDGILTLNCSDVLTYHRVIYAKDSGCDTLGFDDGVAFMFPVSFSTSELLSCVYTVDIVFSDGDVFSLPLNFADLFSSISLPENYTRIVDSYSYRGLTMELSLSHYDSSKYFPTLSFSGEGVELVYMDVVEGTQGNTNHQYITATYDAEDIQPNTAAIQTDIPINGYTVGGVRPTFPVRGDVWFPVEGSRITGVQIYNGQAWEQTNARWWTGSRWIPIYAFDLITLADMWDISSAEGSDVEVTPPITSESGFWNWWRRAWNDFTNKLFGALQGGGTTNPSDPDATPSPSGDPSTLLPGETPSPDDPDDGGGWNVFDLLVSLKDGTWAVVKGVVNVALGGIHGVAVLGTEIGSFFLNVGSVIDAMNGLGG